MMMSLASIQACFYVMCVLLFVTYFYIYEMHRNIVLSFEYPKVECPFYYEEFCAPTKTESSFLLLYFRLLSFSSTVLFAKATLSNLERILASSFHIHFSESMKFANHLGIALYALQSSASYDGFTRLCQEDYRFVFYYFWFEATFALNHWRVVRLPKAIRTFLDYLFGFMWYFMMTFKTGKDEFCNLSKIGFMYSDGRYHYAPSCVNLEKQSREFAKSKYERKLRREESKEDRNRRKNVTEKFNRRQHRLTRCLEVYQNRDAQISQQREKICELVQDIPSSISLSDSQADDFDKLLSKKYHKERLKLKKMEESQARTVEDIVSLASEFSAITFHGEHNGASDVFEDLFSAIKDIPFDGDKLFLCGKILSSFNHFMLCKSYTDYVAFSVGVISNFTDPAIIGNNYSRVMEILSYHFMGQRDTPSTDDDDELEKQSLETLLSMAKHPLTGVVKKLISLVIVLCLAIGYIDKDNFPSALEFALGLPKKVDSNGAMEFVSKTISFVMKMIPFSAGSIDWTEFLSGSTREQRYMKEFEELKYQHLLLCGGDPTRKSEEGSAKWTLSTYRTRLNAFHQLVKDNLKFKKGYDLVLAQRDYLTVSDWVRKVVEVTKSASLVRKPFVLCVMGGPDVGKTALTRYIAALQLAAVDLPHTVSDFGTFNPEDKYDEHADKTALICDDVFQVNPMFSSRNEAMVIMRCGNNTTMIANCANLEEKGRSILNPEYLALTGNGELNPGNYLNHPAAFLRRMNLVIYAELKPEYCAGNTPQMDVEKALPEVNIWNFTMGKYQIDKSSGNATLWEYDFGYNLVPRGQGYKFDLISASNFLVTMSKKHYTAQTAVLDKLNNIGKVWCEHPINPREPDGPKERFLPGACPRCNTSVNIIGISAGPNLPPGVSSTPTGDVVSTQGSEEGNNDSTVEAGPTLDVTIELEHQAKKRSGLSGVLFAFIYSVIYIFVTTLVCTYAVELVPVIRRLIAHLVHKRTLMHYAYTVYMQLVWNLSWLQRTVLMYGLAGFAHIWYGAIPQYFIKRMPKQWQRTVYNFMFVTVFVVATEFIITSTKKLHYWYHEVGYWFGNSMRSALFFFIKDRTYVMARKVKEYAKQNQTKILLILALASVLCMMRLKKQGNVQFGDGPDTWKPPVNHDILLNDCKTASFDDLVSKFTKAQVFVKLHRGFSTVDGNALPYKGYYYLMNAHFFDVMPSKIEVTRYSIEAPQSRYVQPMSKEFVSFIPNTDIAVVFMPKTMRNSDFSFMYGEQFPKHVKCLNIYKSEDGAAVKHTVMAVAQPASASGDHVSECFTYSRESFKGLCGASLIAISARPVVIGMHWAGRDKTCSAVFIQKSKVDAAIKDIETCTEIEGICCPEDVKIPGVEFVELQGKKSFSKLPVEGNLTYIGEYVNSHTYGASKAVPTEIAESVKEFTGFDAFRPTVGKYWEPVWLAQRNMAENSSVNIPFHYLSMAKTDFLNKIEYEMLTNERFRDDITSLCELSFQEALDGTGRPGEEKLKLDTSVGCSVLGDGGKKSRYFSKDEEGHIIPPPEFFSILEAKEENYLQGRSNFIVFKNQIKDEVFAKEKGARVFQVINVEDSVLIRKFFLPICGLMRRWNQLFCNVIGMNVYGPHFETMLVELEAMGPDRLAYGDYKKYDQSVSAEEVMVACSILIWIAERGKYTPRAIKIMQGICSDIANPLLIGNGTAYATNGKIASGINLTIVLDNLTNVMRHISVYYAVNRHLEKPSLECLDSPDLFHHNNTLFVCGDDCINSSSSRVDMSMTSIAKQLAEWGILYTDAHNKGEITVPYGSVKDMVFLKRTANIIDDIPQRVAALDKRSIWKSLIMHIPSKVLTPSQQLADTIDSAAYELFFHGKEYYNESIAFLKDAVKGKPCEQFLRDGVFRSYDARVLEWRATHFGEVDANWDSDDPIVF